MPTFPVSSAGAEAVTFHDGAPSVLVRDVIAASTFESGRGFDDLTPTVTVILPTYRRGDSGMLRACIASVVAQTFTNWELIVVDDGSTDSTRTVIETFIAEDPRIATIRHPRNIGLPGLSCNEAILKARGEKIFFTFDDNSLDPAALETMVAAATAGPDRHFLYAEVFAPYPGHDRTEGTGDFSLARLHEQNFIPNGAVLLDRHVFDRCGMYDPHILLTRLCDWDLWLRVTREYEPFHVEQVIATENGRTQADSLGNSHAWDPALAEEWIASDRVSRLRPDAILDYDVASAPNDLTELSRGKIRAYAQRFFGSRTASDESGTGYLLLLCTEVTAHLRETFVYNREAVRVVPITYFQAEVLGFWDLMLAARGVVFADDVAQAVPLAERLRAAQKDYDYYTPDGSSASTAGERARDEFLAGATRILSRSGDDARPIEVRLGNAAAESPGGLRPTSTSLADLYADASSPDMLAYGALMNNLVRSAPLQPVEVVPEGYYTAAEFAARLRRRLRQQPFAVFRILRSGLRSLRS